MWTSVPQIDATSTRIEGNVIFTGGLRVDGMVRGNVKPEHDSLRAFNTAFPAHRRVSWSNNLIGRSLLDKGQPRAAAEVLEIIRAELGPDFQVEYVRL